MNLTVESCAGYAGVGAGLRVREECGRQYSVGFRFCAATHTQSAGMLTGVRDSEAFQITGYLMRYNKALCT